MSVTVEKLKYPRGGHLVVLILCRRKYVQTDNVAIVIQMMEIVLSGNSNLFFIYTLTITNDKSSLSFLLQMLRLCLIAL